ncbi:histidine phosphatase family protein [Mangrovactinospora gilvigrisea]|uniref:Histidine phosphatase family protein n=1 Tax=Mangrovactinospora gilvigrisea TaxID=1428644 RepID=A0A1J7BHS4_9ACTN|nr:histidine phosphatase family protein [Mangrovactinospora gilvigrisea]OIV38239.1 histidine phosphatase family protein [Mangrovactinospora gilvigrisea]
MRLMLVRHGQTTSNLLKALDTEAPGAELTELGREQAEALVARFAGERVDAVYASVLRRTRATAAPLARERGLTVAVREGLREISAGDLEMNADDESEELYIKTAMEWARGRTGLRIPGGESGAEMLGRFDAAVAGMAGAGASAVVAVSHGAAIRTWVAARAGNIDPDFTLANPLRNTAVVVLEGGMAAGWTAVDWDGSRPAG